MPAVGEVWQHLRFYTSRQTGKLRTKHLFVLAIAPNEDVVYRLLTSKEFNRSRTIVCEQGGDRPGYYLGIPQANGKLSQATWLDLRASDNYDAISFKEQTRRGVLSCIHIFPTETTCPALKCAAYAQDTTRFQKNQMMLSRAMLNCPP